MDKRKFTRLIFLISILICSYTLGAAEADLPTQVNIEKQTLRQCSQGTLKAFSFIQVGFAALYLPDCEQLDSFFTEEPKQLRFLYQRAIPAGAFQRAADYYLEKNLGGQYDKWQAEIERFNENYRDIEEGDYYDLIFLPRIGLSLKLNNLELGKISDPDLALAYFKIWFGAEPFSDDLKQALLGQSF